MTTYPEDDDGAVLTEMAADGIDMTQPLSIDFAVLAPDQAAAVAIDDLLETKGYDVATYYDDGDPDEEEAAELDDDEEFEPTWTVYVQFRMVPDYHEIIRIQEDLKVLVEPLGGVVDGWGAMLEGEQAEDEKQAEEEEQADDE